MRGSIKQRGRTFSAYWSTTDPATGARRQHSKGGFRTKGAAQKHLNGVLAKVDEGSWRPDQPLTVRQLLEDHWVPAQRSRELRPATIDQQEGVANRWIIPHLGGVRSSALTPKMVVEWIDTLRTTKTASGRPGLSPRSAQLATTVLKSAYKFGCATGLLSTNPIASVKPPARRIPR
jgi:hypothetical protein